MSSGKFFTLTTSLILGVFIIFIGCSDNDLISNVNNGSVTSSEAENWFPLDEGYMTVYKVTTAGSQKTVSYKIQGDIEINGESAIQWLSNDPSTGADTGYFKYTNDAVYYFDSKTSSPEKVIQLPITSGSSWNRFTETTIDIRTNDFGDILDDQIKDSVTVINLNKTLPVVGSAIMTVEKADVIELEEANLSFASAYRISAPSTNSGTNYYWFVQGVGLVKYVLDATAGNYNSGSVTGELVEYGFPVE